MIAPLMSDAKLFKVRIAPARSFAALDGLASDAADDASAATAPAFRFPPVTIVSAMLAGFVNVV